MTDTGMINSLSLSSFEETALDTKPSPYLLD